MPGPVFLRGDRLDLRVATESDLSFVTEWRNPPDVRRWMPRSRPERPADTEGFYDEFVKGIDGSGVCLLPCVDDEPLGLVSSFLVDADSRRARPCLAPLRQSPPVARDRCAVAHSRRARLGAWLTPDAQGQGYGTEAASLQVTDAFGERDLRKLVANVRADNDPSRAVLEGLGFREEGRQREHSYVDGEYVDRVIYGLLLEEWEKEE